MAMRILGGVFLLISSIIGWLMVAVFAFALGIVSAFDPTGVASSLVGVCTILWAIFSFMAMLGAIMAIAGRSWGFALVGGVMALFIIGPYFLGSIFGLIGLVIIAISRDEFDQKRSMRGLYTPPRPSFYGPPPIRGKR